MNAGRFREQIAQMLAELDREDARGQDGQSVVTLDQQAVGRLSRMDALQSQAMAKAQQSRRDARRAALKSALRRIDDGEFGWCEDCGDTMDELRLLLNPAVVRCVSCIKG